MAAPLSAPSLLSPPRAALSAPALGPGEPRRRSPRIAHPHTSSSRRHRPRSAAAAALPRRPHGGLPQARPADAAGAEGHGQPAPHQLHQGHDRGRLRVSEGGGHAATQPRPHAGAAPPHPGASSGLAMVLRGAVPGSRCPETLRCRGDRAPRAAVPVPARRAEMRRVRPCLPRERWGGVRWDGERAGPIPALPRRRWMRRWHVWKWRPGAPRAEPARAGPRRSAVPAGVVTARKAGNAKLVQDWKPKNLCPRRKRLLFHCVPVSWN